GIRDRNVTGVQTCALPISVRPASCRILPICWWAMSEEFVEYAGHSEPKERWLKALPLIIAGVLGIPLLAAAIYFSVQIAQITKYSFDLGTPGWEAVGMVSGRITAGLW